MTKEINPKSIRCGLTRIGYEQGLLAGYTKSIVLLRHMQRSLTTRRHGEHQLLEEAMELISEQIKPEEVE